MIDINARRRVLVEKYHGNTAKILGNLRGFFKSAVGGTAVEVLSMPAFRDVAVVVGGVYFASPENDKSWPNIDEKTHQGDGLIWYKPDPKKKGHVLSEQQGNFTSGGYLSLDFQGRASLTRLRDMKLQDTPMDHYRIIVQSNLILVDNGQEDGNSNGSRNAVAALSTQSDGTLSLVVAAEQDKPSNGNGFTPKEFGDLLVKWGSKFAINLDGGPSTQFAVRGKNCKNKNPQSCIMDLIHHTDPTNPMSQVFSVSK